MMMPLVLAVAVVSACDDDDDESDADAPTATVVATATVPDEVQLEQEDDGSNVQLAVDGTLIIALPSNPSTGFSWAVTPPEPVGLELEGEPEYVPPGSTTPAVGAAGTQVFTFTATAAGETTLTLTYARNFEPGAAGEETFTVTVEVIGE
jgi:inhibitor of cysteine peptidase